MLFYLILRDTSSLICPATLVLSTLLTGALSGPCETAGRSNGSDPLDDFRESFRGSGTPQIAPEDFSE